MQPTALAREAPPPVIISGDGVTIRDAQGREFIDCQGGLWCVNAGHNRTEIKDAIVAQLNRLQYYTNFPGSVNEPSLELSRKLIEITQPEGMRKVMYGSGGSDANESAFKIARQYWKLVGKPGKIKFISLKNGYHGLHFGTMSACGANAWKASYEPMVPGFFQVESPHVYRNPFTEDPEALSALCATLLERELEYQTPDTIAAVIAEPIQGAGGVIVPPASYWPRLREICDRHDVLLIADEVITGLGRSGSLFGVRGWAVKPDIMCLAKGLTSGYIPLSATLMNDRIASAFDSMSPHSVFMHGYTYSGHPVACAAGLASIDLVLKEKLSENSADVGEYFLSRLKSLQTRHRAIGDVRGKGLMIAIELVKNRETKEPFTPFDAYPGQISEGCVASGVMIRTIVNKLIISPPLTFTRDHVDQVVNVLDQVFSAHPF
ncbi:aspartate aminotransferase family protein [Pandoraea cepalis]|uniref:Aspartate aminotransferase family protein n=1 Tax=Pandoraea cepalis TaxID=2508294 RepID=A0AAW7MHQ1_9BURK|nr:aspartate aminotransferase family protein [Pandoraea cepalis]MDN4576874.1 aspartate aminotransferase family protein [Pandoraea cepalis]